MANVVGVCARRASSNVKAAAHNHQILSRLILCPVKNCRDRALALFGRAAETLKPKRTKRSNGQYDADEGVPGYLREPHLPTVITKATTSN